MPITKSRPGLTGNQLKILAMIAMTCDHVCMELLPSLGFLRIIGRLAMPIYAYMIAEGCRHTRNRRKYFLRLAGLALLCQGVYFIAMRSLFQCILVTFSLSVALTGALDIFDRRPDLKSGLLVLGALGAAAFLCLGLPRMIPGFDIDYGLAGVLLPVGIYLGASRPEKLVFLTLGLTALGMVYGGIQWYAYAAVPILALYNGQKGALSIGRLFYWYYPAHLAAIYLLSLALEKTLSF